MKTDYATYDLSKKETAYFLAVGYLIGFAVLFLFYHNLIFSLVGGCLAYLFLGWHKKHLAEKRRIFLTTQFKDLLYSLSASVAAGHQIEKAMEDAVENLSLVYHESTPMVKELKQMVKGISENRESDVNLLLDFARRSNCEDIRNFVQVYITCRTMGGNLEKVLKNTIEILLDKMSIEKEIKTLTAQKKFEGKIISAMPLAIIVFLNVFSPDYLLPLYTTVGGRIIMTLAVAGILGAYYLTEKLTNIEV